MTRTSFIPRTKEQRRTWAGNFIPKLVSGGYDTKYNIEAATVTSLQQGLAWIEWSFNNITGLRAKSQSLTEFQDQLMNGKGASGALGVPTAFTYTAMPNNGATPPVTITPMANIIGLAASVAKQIKAAANYSVADGEDLGIEGPAAPELPPVESTAPDLSKSRMASGGGVELVWKKDMFDGIRIEVDRGGTGGSGSSGWVFLALDTQPNYIDTVMPAPGTVAVFKYRAIYVLDDQPYGQWSQVLEMTVRG